ncbi:MAG: hypothetical protein IT201_08450 [Thermoleophilia bacterium]|nr:hypothetical protein [Thermoleophilia bacterium]
MAELTSSQRSALSVLADVLVPAHDGLPAASEADAGGKWLARVLAARPDLEAELVRVLAGAAGREPAAELRRLEREDRTGFETLALVVTSSYFLSPKVRRRIGYPGQVASPPYPDESDYHLRDGLLDPVLERGSIYRPTPGSEDGAAR